MWRGIQDTFWELEEAVAEAGPNAIGIPCDISKSHELDVMFDGVQRKAGRIDVLFANAGGGDLASLTAVTEDHDNRIFDTNVKGTVFTVQKALPLLKEGASVILTGSTSATTGVPDFSGWHGLSSDDKFNREMIRAVEATTPLGRLAEPSEVAAAELFLTSDDSRFVNGSELFVDGGSAQI